MKETTRWTSSSNGGARFLAWVKSGNKQAAGGMSAFQKQMQPDRLILLGNEGLPWQEFLKINPLELF